MKNKAMNKMLSLLLTAAMALGVLAAPPLTAYAADEVSIGTTAGMTPETAGRAAEPTNPDSSPQVSSPTLDDSTTVWFGGHQWVIIGWDGEGVASQSGKATLLYANANKSKPATTKFGSTTLSNEYADSSLRTAMTNFYNTLADKEKDAITQRSLDGGNGRLIYADAGGISPIATTSFSAAAGTLSADQYITGLTLAANDTFDWYAYHALRTPADGYIGGAQHVPSTKYGAYHPDKIFGAGVTGHFWPLSVAEASLLSSSIRSYSSNWWLRSSTIDYHNVAYVNFEGIVDSFGAGIGSYAVRPAFHLNLSSVLFASAASGASAKSTAVGGPLSAAKPLAQNLKFTMLDTEIEKPTITNLSTDPTSVRFDYSGAKTVAGYYLSCVLEGTQGTDNGVVKFYGKLADCLSNDSGSVTLPLTGINDGTYTLKIFCEQANGDNNTDFAGASVDMELVMADGIGQIAGLPSITTAPAGQSVNAGNTATFTVAATGDGPLSYQWQVNTGDGFVDVTDGIGGTTVSYTTPSTTAGMSGWQYRVKVSNAAGSIYSESAVLTVNTPPTFMSATTSEDGTKVFVTFSKTMSETGLEAGDFTVTSGGSGNAVEDIARTVTNPATVELTLTTPITHGQTVTVAYTAGTAQAADGGVLESFGEQSVTNAVPSPVITINTQPQGTTTVTEGSISGNLAVSATVTQGAALNYEWFSCDDTSRANPVTTGETSNNFTIPSGLSAGTYYYYCEVSATGATPVNSNVAKVIVNAPPTFMSATTSEDGRKVFVTFSKTMRETGLAAGDFIVTSHAANTVTAIALNTNPTIVELTLTTPITHGQTVTVAYTAGTAQAADGGVLESFGEQSVTNAVPSPVITINTQPQGTTTVTEGSISGNLAVSATVTQGAALNYEWFSCDDTSRANPVTTGETSNNFTIPSGLSAGTYYYYCEVSATGATPVNSNVAKVIVNAPPHTIAASAGTGGVISPSGNVTVDDSADKTFTISPNSGYHISSVTVDEINQGAIGSYTFTNVTSGHTISATFARNSSHNNNDSDGGSSYTPPATPITIEDKQPNMPTLAKASVTGTVQDKVLSATITEKMAKDAIAAAGSNADGIAVQLNVTGSGSYTSLTATFERKALEALKTAGVKYVQIGSTLIDLSLDTKAITEILNQATGNVTVSVTAQGKLSDEAKRLIGSRPVFDITIKDNKGITVSNLKNGTVTIGIYYEPAGWEKKGNLYSVYVDRNGKTQLLTNSSYDNGKVIFGRGSLSIYGLGYKTPAPAFTDTVNHWAKEDIDFIASRELISGTNATQFLPNTNITRTDFLMALGKLSGADVSGYKTSSFTDVANDSPAMPYIEWALNNGIVQGIGNNKFAPASFITREQMAIMMVNYAKVTNYTLPVSRQAVTFADNAKISSWAKDAVKSIQQTGVIVGKPGNLYDPQGNATRAEASAILHHFIELVIDEGTARGWVQNDAGQWQYINTYGKAAIGWLNITNGTKYYFDDKGVMVSNKWLQVGGKWYYFYSDGKLATSTTIDGYTVDSDGVRKD